MALFTDPDIVTLDDLLRLESSLVQVSTTHGIDVATKINLTVAAITDKVMLWLLNSGASDPQFLQRRKIGLSTVVVTPTLYRWLCCDSLSRFFAEAYNVQLNTRFQQKWTEYQHESRTAADMFFMSGVGIVYQPLPRPALPMVTIGTGAMLAGSLFVQTTWVDNKGNESAPSRVNGEIVPNFSSVTVTAAASGGVPPTAATGWNVYTNTSDANLVLQNATPVPLGTNWQLSSQWIASGTSPSSGQQPDFYIELTKRILRG